MENKFKKWNLNVVELTLFRLAYENRLPGFTIEKAKELIELNREGLGAGILQALNELIDSAEARKESRLITAAA